MSAKAFPESSIRPANDDDRLPTQFAYTFARDVVNECSDILARMPHSPSMKESSDAVYILFKTAGELLYDGTRTSFEMLQGTWRCFYASVQDLSPSYLKAFESEPIKRMQGSYQAMLELSNLKETVEYLKKPSTSTSSATAAVAAPAATAPTEDEGDSPASSCPLTLPPPPMDESDNDDDIPLPFGNQSSSAAEASVKAEPMDVSEDSNKPPVAARILAMATPDASDNEDDEPKETHITRVAYSTPVSQRPVSHTIPDAPRRNRVHSVLDVNNALYRRTLQAVIDALAAARDQSN